MRPLPSNERELRRVAAALSRGDQTCELEEGELALGPIRAAIRRGDDPLGTWFCELRSSAARREDGATYTPALIVSAMTAWAVSQSPAPQRIVDPGCGSGRYLMAAAVSFPKAQLIAIEIDPLARMLLKANAVVCGFADRLTIKACDYRELELPTIDGRTLFIGNPPYVRHHDIAEDWKAWFQDAAAELGFRASRLAGLHIHFFLKTRLLAHPGDFGVFITAAEWIDVNYGSVLREMLTDGMGGIALHLIDPSAEPFPDAMVTGAITCFHVGARASNFSIRAVGSLAELGTLAAGEPLPWERVATARRWSALVRRKEQHPDGFIELGEVFRVHRGTVTGSNRVWIAGEHATDIPPSLLFPSVTKAREIIAAGQVLKNAKALRCVVDIPPELDGFDRSERRAIDRFLKWARAMGADQTYTAFYRRAWWSVGLRDPAPILCTYMGRRSPAFALNAAHAHFLNIAHGLYPRAPLPQRTLAAYAEYLRKSIQQHEGRTYAGGLTKFEPKELERVLVPAIDQIHEIIAEMDNREDQGGRSDREGCIPTAAT
jgi:hypothetical protein